MDVDWQADLERWLVPFVAALRQDEGTGVSRLYRRLDWSRRPQGRPADGNARWRGQLRSASPLRRAPLEAALLKKADDLAGRPRGRHPGPRRRADADGDAVRDASDPAQALLRRGLSGAKVPDGLGPFLRCAPVRLMLRRPCRDC